MRHLWRRAVPGAVALILISAQTSDAIGSLVQEKAFSTQVNLVSCNDPANCLSHSTNATGEIADESPNHFTIRFGLNVNADAGPFSGAIESGIATYTTEFTIAPGNYDLTITAYRVGALRRTADEFLCEGSVALSEMGAPIFTINGVADERLSDFVFPGASIANGEGDADATVPNVVQSQVIVFRGRLIPDQFSLTFAMNATAVSGVCAVSARLGAPNLGTLGCDSCDYPGVPARDLEEDGLFVEVNIEDKCGDGLRQDPEVCDLGDLNGTPGSCCDVDCTGRVDRLCRTATGPCDETDTCNASGECPDGKQPAGRACDDDGDDCTTDQCNAIGECVHMRSPVLCPGRCGDALPDAGEECDLGDALNGQIFACCTAGCKHKTDQSLCDDGVFCNGTDTCLDGACAAHIGSCSELGACAICNEQTFDCDTSQCPSPCGNGQKDEGEDCDLGRLLNGEPSNCCDASCKFRLDNSTCEDGLFCNGVEHCTSGVCGGAAGNPCSGLGTCAVCDEANNACDTSQCVDLCGNGQLDAGEDCDLGRLVNGEPTNCCDAACKRRPDNSTCTDQLFCNGNEHCTGGVCGGSAGTPCNRTCESCDEANNTCDPSACPPPPPLPAQPTRELLIAEIFDGDGDGFSTSAGGSVRGTLDLDANADLRFTAADLPRLPRCADDAVLVGGVCIDKYEASVFENPPGSSDLGFHYGADINEPDYPCREDGSDCPLKIFALSLSGTVPSVNCTWFQAQQACASVGKRLMTNGEWQMAAAGTPDTGNDDDNVTSCNTNSEFVALPAGSRSACVSKWGIHDMVGNVWEWVAEWVPASTDCPGWGAFSDDTMCLAGASSTAKNPGALIRGGGAGFTADAGPLAIRGDRSPSTFSPVVGFRCARAPF